ncbi:conjugal transfer protein TraR [Sphingomonas sp. AR_OL41]|uniref:conjugal transfer protein TraR n=1 Tax=Sphingomonas sp. AR_OL41 TaxID=3042729 RepID=UPI0024816D3E|nr:conjugal transfer protein TraR [Sphingomonas sp. AR_OL41]MDH7971749.1 conjugal transfer protein TraR [Sphingomonas sp. AR_OL41]
MADEAEIAFDVSQALVERGLAGIARALPPGVAGVCAECGENMPRLVGGRCGFCRDGRFRPPPSSNPAFRPSRFHPRRSAHH